MDAGTKDVDYYARHLPSWRFWLRSKLLAIVRQETEVLARIQNSVRCGFLDLYFAQSANIGTHTFYMIMLPVFFWYGNAVMGIQVVLVLALGVFITGFIKDLTCLPRPRSPPLQRISMSASAKLEYGMPSTHSCNAVGVALVFHQFGPDSRFVFWVSIWLITTLVLGRIYTGMHGFIDIVFGCLTGLFSYWLSLVILKSLDHHYIWDNSVLTLLFVLGIWLSPNPADDCPCFDDSVAFIGVVLGMVWTLAFVESPTPFGVKFADAGLSTRAYAAKALARFLVGVLFVVAWRAVSKRVLLRILPPIWRFLDRIGVRHPRRHFVRTDSKVVLTPTAVEDTILDGSPRELLQNLRRRRPTITVGPQSEVDLHELRSQETPPARESMAPGQVQHTRQHYDFEVFMRLIVYGGIGPIALFCAKHAYTYLDI